MRKRILAIIYSSIDEINRQREMEERLELSPDTVLYGADGQLDSLTLVELIVTTEQRIEDEFSVLLTLANERALARKGNPFRSVATLAEYVMERLEEVDS